MKTTADEPATSRRREGRSSEDVLRANVHPPSWQPPDPRRRYDLVVIGGGTAGLVTASGAASLGARVALIEREALGGDCLISGCVPSKALLRAARAVREMRSASRFGIVARAPEVDFSAVMQRMRSVRAGISNDDSAKRLASLGIHVFFGEARFVSPREVEVNGRTLNFRRACIATGSSPVTLDIPAPPGRWYRTNETLFELERLPGRLTIIGGGPIGCEMAQAFAAFGSKVTIVESGDRILSKEIPEASELLARRFEEDGIRILTRHEVTAARIEDEDLHLTVDGPDTTDLVSDEVLVAIGRKPGVKGLNLAAAEIDHDPEEGVQVDDRLRTSNQRVFAAGDVCSSYKFTHAADALGRIVVGNALFWGRQNPDDLVIPWCTYTDPEIARVGRTEDEARERGHETEVFRIDLEEIDRARIDGADPGFLSIVVEAGRKRRVLGVTVVAPRAGELISRGTIAIERGQGLAELSKTIVPYPTLGEIFRKAGDRGNRERLTPFVRRLASFVLGLGRLVA